MGCPKGSTESGASHEGPFLTKIRKTRFSQKPPNNFFSLHLSVIGETLTYHAQVVLFLGIDLCVKLSRGPPCRLSPLHSVSVYSSKEFNVPPTISVLLSGGACPLFSRARTRVGRCLTALLALLSGSDGVAPSPAGSSCLCRPLQSGPRMSKPR